MTVGITIPLPVRGPLWPPRQGERQGQGRGDRRLLPPELPGADAKVPETSMISTRILKPAAPSDGRNNCVATTRRSANAWSGIVRFFSAFAQIACDACDKRPGRVSSLSLVRYRGTDYSVPTRFGHCEVLVRGYVHEVVISCAAEVIARHPRSYGQEDFVFDPAALTVLAGAKDQRAGSGGSLGRLAVAAGVRRSPPPT